MFSISSSSSRKILWFVVGLLFATIGLKILGSLDAKKIYAQIMAFLLRGKNYIMSNITDLQEYVGDIVADAKEINCNRSIKPEIIKDCSQVADK